MRFYPLKQKALFLALNLCKILYSWLWREFGYVLGIGTKEE